MIPIDRFNEKFVVDEVTHCWNWVAGKARGGYGMFWFEGKTMPAHRWAYNYWMGSIPLNQFVCHACDNPSCVNPNHLWTGTSMDNVSDMVLKIRQAKGSKQGLSKLLEQQIKSIRSDKRLQKAIAKEFGIHQTQVSNIKTRKQWGHI